MIYHDNKTSIVFYCFVFNYLYHYRKQTNQIISYKKNSAFGENIDEQTVFFVRCMNFFLQNNTKNNIT